MRKRIQLQAGFMSFLLLSSMAMGTVRPPSLENTREAFDRLQPAFTAAAGMVTFGELVRGVFQIPRKIQTLGLDDLFQEVLGSENSAAVKVEASILPVQDFDKEEDRLFADAFDDLAFH